MSTPDELEALADAFEAGLRDALGARYVGMFTYGAAMFPPSPVSDFDAHVVIDGELSTDDRAKIHSLHDDLAALPQGDDLDVWYVTADDIRGTTPPVTRMRDDGFADESWALHRAHIHAGRYTFRGPDPRDIVPEPTWDEIDEALQSELGFLEDNLASSPAYGVLNLCRILYSYETRDVVVGKFQAALWAQGFCDVDDHALIREALDAYTTKMYAIDRDVMPFVVRMCALIARARAFG